MMFVVYWRGRRLRNNQFIMLYLFATVFYDLSHGDGRDIADLKRGLECDLRELDNASVRYSIVSIVSEYVRMLDMLGCLLCSRTGAPASRSAVSYNLIRSHLEVMHLQT